MEPVLTQLPTEVTSPASQLLPYLTTTLSFLKSLLTLFIHILVQTLKPLRHLSPVPVLLYLFAPLLVFLDITTALFIRTPYRTAVYLVEAVYPLYVLVGVACITGAILGLAARLISRVAIVSLQYQDNGVDGSLPPRPTPPKGEAKADAVERKRKSRKAEKMKAET